MSNDAPNSSGSEAAVSGADLTLGSIVQSHSHMDYVAEAYRDKEREEPPEKHDYEFGQPVYVLQTVRGDEYAVVGVIYDTKLVDPDQGRDGPRLSAPDQEMLVPGYVNEKQTLLGIALLGFSRLKPVDGTDGAYRFAEVNHDMPRWTLDVDDLVYKLPPEGFRQFHVTEDGFSLQYYDRLVSTADRFGAEVTLRVLDHLRTVADVDEELLDVIEQKVHWESSSDRGVVR